MYQTQLISRRQKPTTKMNHKRLVTLAATIALTVVGFTGVASTPLAQAAGNPGVPQPGTVIYEDDFSGVDATGAAIPIENPTTNTVSGTSATGYTGAPPVSMTYTASPAWESTSQGCDGWVVNSSTPKPTSDGGTGYGCSSMQGLQWQRLLVMSQALGAFQAGASAGSITASSASGYAGNQVVLAYTQDTRNSNTRDFSGTVLETTGDPTGTTGHFYDVTVDYAEMNCFAQHASLDDYLLVDGTTAGTMPTQPSKAEVDAAFAAGTPLGVEPCASAADAYLFNGTATNGSDTSLGSPTTIANINNASAKAAAFAMMRTSSVALQVTATGSDPANPANVPLGFSIYNAQVSGLGNDAEYDLPQIVDVTPSLDKTFDPTVVAPGQVSMLTFTITNTAELMEKDDWSFTDTLPAGLVVADSPTASTTCNSLDTAVRGANAHGAELTADPGSSTVTMMGALAPGEVSCTVTVPVVSSKSGTTFTNDVSNLTPGPGAACASLPANTQGACGLLPPDPATLTIGAPPSGDPQSDVRAVNQTKSFDPAGAHLVCSVGKNSPGFILSKTTVDKRGLPSSVTVSVDPSTGVVTAASSVPGVYQIPVTYIDNNGLSVTVIDTLTVVSPAQTSITPVGASGTSAETGGSATSAASLVPMLFALMLAISTGVVVWRRRLGRDIG